MTNPEFPPTLLAAADSVKDADKQKPHDHTERDHSPSKTPPKKGDVDLERREKLDEEHHHGGREKGDHGPDPDDAPSKG